MGVQMAEKAFEKVLEEYPEKVRGEDFVNLGYKVGGMVTIQAMGRSLPEVYPMISMGASMKTSPC